MALSLYVTHYSQVAAIANEGYTYAALHAARISLERYEGGRIKKSVTKKFKPNARVKTVDTNIQTQLNTSHH